MYSTATSRNPYSRARSASCTAGVGFRDSQRPALPRRLPYVYDCATSKHIGRKVTSGHVVPRLPFDFALPRAGVARAKSTTVLRRLASSVVICSAFSSSLSWAAAFEVSGRVRSCIGVLLFRRDLPAAEHPWEPSSVRITRSSWSAPKKASGSVPASSSCTTRIDCTSKRVSPRLESFGSRHTYTLSCRRTSS